ncbi:MAG: hypothetical protein D6762_09885 [Candidatus Neomarinimicrobiota bacterium]|nr:MAG: hypothetical protein D6762_09885 [Candidatus Neomarinimicrobiota bacterium]
MNTVTIFMIPQQFPCGPDSSCCGPIGQTAEEIAALEQAIRTELPCEVQIVDASLGSNMKHHLPVARLIQSMGAQALPIIALNGEVVSLGNPRPEEAVSLLKSKLNVEVS